MVKAQYYLCNAISVMWSARSETIIKIRYKRQSRAPWHFPI